MLIGLGVTITGLPLLKAGAGTPPGESFAAGIDEFSRDRTLFDCGLAQGRNGADIPLSGSTNAPEGTAILCEIINASTGATVHPPRAIATAAGGAWAGSYPGVERNAGWLKPRVWVEDSADRAEPTRSFGVGLVAFFEEQSLFAYHLSEYYDVPALTASVSDPEAVQILLAEDRGSPSEKDIPSADTYAQIQAKIRRRFLNDAQQSNAWYTASMSHMAETICANAPGLKVMLVCDVKAGTSMGDLLSNNFTNRKFDVSRAIAEAVHADGAKVGLIVQTHDREDNANDPAIYFPGWISTVIFGKNANDGTDFSTDFPYYVPDNEFTGTTRVDHIWPEIYPEFREYSQMTEGTAYNANLYNNPESLPYVANTRHGTIGGDGSDWDANDDPMGPPGGIWKYMRQRDWLKNNLDGAYLKTRMQISPITFMQKHGLGTENDYADPHHDVDDPYAGVVAVARMRMASMLGAVGLGAGTGTLDNAYYAPDGSYIDLWSSAGPITTLQKYYGLSPLDGSDPTDTDVVGFQYDGPRGQEFVERAEIVDEDGNAADQGRIRIYPLPGDTFTSTSYPYYMAKNGHGSRSKFERGDRDKMRFYPLVLTGWNHFPGWQLQPPAIEDGGIDWIQAQNPFEITGTTPDEPVFAVSGGAPGWKTRYAPQAAGATIEARYARTLKDGALAGFKIVEKLQERVSMVQYAKTGNVSVTVKDSNFKRVFIGSVATLSTAELQQMHTYRVAVTLTTSTVLVRLFIDDEEQFGDGFGVVKTVANTGRMDDSSYEIFADTTLEANVAWVKIWQSAESDGAAPVSDPFAQVVAGTEGSPVATNLTAES